MKTLTTTARALCARVCVCERLSPSPQRRQRCRHHRRCREGGPYVDAFKSNLLPEPGFSRRRRRPQILLIMQNRNFMNHTYACIRQVLCRVPMSGTCVKSPRFPTPDLLDHETRLWEKQCGNEVCLDLLCRWMGGF